MTTYPIEAISIGTSQECVLDELIQTLKDAYETRLRKKFVSDEQKKVEVRAAAVGETPLSILRKLRDLDDDWR